MEWIRLGVVVLMGGIAATCYVASLRHDPALLLRDPATALYPLVLVGLCVRLFWARFLTICFVVGLAIAQSAWVAVSPWQTAGVGLVVLLLMGEPMRAMFEGRSSRYNRWTDGIAHVEPLKRVFIFQTIALAALFPVAQVPGAPSGLVGVTLALATFGMVGLVFQKTWGLVVVATAVSLEAWLAATVFTKLAGADMVKSATPWPELAIGIGATGSLAMLVPFFRDIARFLR